MFSSCSHSIVFTILATLGKSSRKNKTDPYLGFPNELLRDLWYRIIKEVICGWKIVFSEQYIVIADQTILLGRIIVFGFQS